MDWACEAYGEDMPMDDLCFFETSQRCTSEQICAARMRQERKRVYRRMNELAAHGDEVADELTRYFTHPGQMLGGPDQPDPDS